MDKGGKSNQESIKSDTGGETEAPKKGKEDGETTPKLCFPVERRMGRNAGLFIAARSLNCPPRF